MSRNHRKIEMGRIGKLQGDHANQRSASNPLNPLSHTTVVYPIGCANSSLCSNPATAPESSPKARLPSGRGIQSLLNSLTISYNVFFPSAFTFAHLALAIAASLALTAGLILRSAFLPAFGVTWAAFTLAHRAFVAATMAALPAALNCLLPIRGVLEAFGVLPLIRAHRALAPAAILARAAADMRRFLGAFTADAESFPPPPASASSFPFSFSICSLMAIIRCSWIVVKSIRFVIGDW
jgi:hypothetical protein